MTIHRALAELKLIDSRIEKQITSIAPVGFKQKDKLILSYISEDDFKLQAQSKLDSINALIIRKVSIKSAVVAANCVTMVNIGQKTLSIADAITFKGVLDLKKKLVSILKQQHSTVVGSMNKNNENVAKNLQLILEAMFGKENVKVSKDDSDNVAKPYLEANEFHFIDPLNVLSLIDSIEKEISEFETEVDAVLSEIYATTFIEI